jgi:hypothetical protein
MAVKRLAFSILLFMAGTENVLACKELIGTVAFRNADVVVVGAGSPSRSSTLLPSGKMSFAFTVTRVLKGKAPAKIDIVEPEAGCYGYRLFFQGAGEYVVFLKRVDGELQTGHPYPNNRLPTDPSAKEALLAEIIGRGK